MDTLSNILLLIAQLLGLWIIVSMVVCSYYVLYQMVIYRSYDRAYAREDEQDREIFFNDIEEYLTKQADYETFFNQIEEYR